MKTQKTHKVTNKEFKNKKFQSWIKTSMGDINDGDKNSQSVYLNKAGEEVFMYDFTKEELIILQPKLTIQQLVMYGLNVSAVVKPLKEGMKTFSEFILEADGDTEFHKYSKNSIKELELLLKHHKEDLEEGDCDKEEIIKDIKEIEKAIAAK